MMILLRDLPKENLKKIFGEEMRGGHGDPDPLVGKYRKRYYRKCSDCDIEISDSETQVERLNLGPW